MIPVACAVAAIAIATPALAKPRKAVRLQAPPPVQATYLPDPATGLMVGNTIPAPAAVQEMRRKNARQTASSTTGVAASVTPAAEPTAASFGFGGSAVVAEARRYLGTNPTGRSSLWCGAFMDMVLKRTGHEGGGNLAHAYASYGTRVAGPQVGAIAVMSRGKRGGHVGVVSGIDPTGNPIIISGNHNRRVAEAVYPKGRIYAYVMPGS
jgi:uncharacterized protein (TIGR02594 family)